MHNITTLLLGIKIFFATSYFEILVSSIINISIWKLHNGIKQKNVTGVFIQTNAGEILWALGTFPFWALHAYIYILCDYWLIRGVAIIVLWFIFIIGSKVLLSTRFKENIWLLLVTLCVCSLTVYLGWLFKLPVIGIYI